MRRQGVAGEAVVEHLVEDGALVDSLCREDVFAEQVVIDVRDGAGVDVESGLARIELREPRARGGGYAYPYARLQYSIPSRHDAMPRVHDRPVQRVRDGADHSCCGVAGQLRVGVQRYDITNIIEKMQRTGLHREAVILIKQKLVQI